MKGILFSQMEPSAVLESEFNDWYQGEHIPVRLALPGFSRALRYKQCEEERKYLAVYEIDDLAVLDSPGYGIIKTKPSERTARMLNSVKGFTRYTCTLAYDSAARPERGRYLLVVAHAVPRDQEAQLDDWYESVIPVLMESADWLRIRRFKVFSRDGGAWTDIALHELRSSRALDGMKRNTASADNKLAALAVEPWFAAAGRWLYELYSVHNATQQPQHGE
jgi:hypothetical protein